MYLVERGAPSRHPFSVSVLFDLLQSYYFVLLPTFGFNHVIF